MSDIIPLFVIGLGFAIIIGFHISLPFDPYQYNMAHARAQGKSAEEYYSDCY